MGFTSFIFPLFLVVVVALYYIVPQKCTWVILLAASWFFYGYANWQVFVLLPSFSLVTWLAAILIERTKSEKGKKAWFILTLLVIFGALFVFKYFGLFADTALSIASMLGAKVDDFTFYIVLPIGISFYTFQTASYVIDVYLGKCQAERHFGYYALFVSFFPQLVAGPIERLDSLMPQLKVKHAFDWNNVKQGIAMMTAGYVKKIFVADVVAQVVNAVYLSKDLSSLSSPAVLVATGLFFVQIYCDFSGYSDIAVGTAKLMGIDLMKNFNHPFAAQTVSEFWERWHISLSSWFNEYLYRPLAFRTFRKKNKRFYYAVNTLIVMLLSGFWHGAEWSFLLWGAVLAVYQIVGSFLKKGEEVSKFRQFLRKVRTFVLLCLSVVLFRAENVSVAGQLYARILMGWSGESLSAFFTQTTLTAPYIAVIVCGILAMTLCDKLVTDDNGKSVVTKKYALPLLGAAVVLIVLAFTYLTANGQGNAFIYFQF